jgi:hypothetical protein
MNANQLIATLLQEHERYRALDRDALRDKLSPKPRASARSKQATRSIPRSNKNYSTNC